MFYQAVQLKADAELQAHRKWETSIPLGGNPADVYCIDVAWSMGDISDDEIGNNRKSVLEQAFFVWPNREDNEQYILETLRSAKTALHEILDRASRGEPVRIWYSHNPDEICGFYWLLAQLKKLPAIGSIYAVKLPEWEYSTDNTLCTHIGWGEISPEEWGKYLPLQREVKPALLNACAMRWKQLQQENAPLRIYSARGGRASGRIFRSKPNWECPGQKSAWHRRCVDRAADGEVYQRGNVHYCDNSVCG